MRSRFFSPFRKVTDRYASHDHASVCIVILLYNDCNAITMQTIASTRSDCGVLHNDRPCAQRCLLLLGFFDYPALGCRIEQVHPACVERHGKLVAGPGFYAGVYPSEEA